MEHGMEVLFMAVNVALFVLFAAVWIGSSQELDKSQELLEKQENETRVVKLI